jgi:hypothetical protein
VWHELNRHLAAVQRGWDVVSAFAADDEAVWSHFDLPRWVNGPDDEAFPARLVARSQQALAARETLLPWVQYRQAAHQARERGLAAFVDALERERGVAGPSCRRVRLPLLRLDRAGHLCHAAHAAAFLLVRPTTRFAGNTARLTGPC